MKQIIINENKDEISCLTYIPNYMSNIDSEKIKTTLYSMDDWKEGKRNDGKNIDRKQKWYHMENKTFCDTWKIKHNRWNSHSYTPLLFKLQESVQNDLSNILINTSNIKYPNLNSILINYYQDGNQFIPPHKDTKVSFGLDPTIILLSFGATRKFKLERTLPDSYEINSKQKFWNQEFDLEDNSLLIMSGSVQKYFLHSIEKSDTSLPRYSITFREHLF